MATMKKYGLIFDNLSVLIAEVVVNKSQHFCTNGLSNELYGKLQSFLKENNYHPIEVIPDTALSGCDYRETIIRKPTKVEKEEYLEGYKQWKE